MKDFEFPMDGMTDADFDFDESAAGLTTLMLLMDDYDRCAYYYDDEER